MKPIFHYQNLVGGTFEGNLTYVNLAWIHGYLLLMYLIDSLIHTTTKYCIHGNQTPTLQVQDPMTLWNFSY